MIVLNILVGDRIVDLYLIHISLKCAQTMKARALIVMRVKTKQKMNYKNFNKDGFGNIDIITIEELKLKQMGPWGINFLKLCP